MDYESWIKFLFDRRIEEEAWFFDENFNEPLINDTLLLQHSIQLFSDIKFELKPYSNEQIAFGLEYLINPSCGSWCYSFTAPSGPRDLKRKAILSMKEIFLHLFACRCESMPFKSSKKNRINWLCYMWWDIFPRHGVPSSKDYDEIDQAILEVLRSILTSNNSACVESAIHGLSHWMISYPEIATEILESCSSKVPVALKSYYQSALSGDVI